MIGVRSSDESDCRGYKPADSKTTKKLVAQALALRDGRKTTVLDLLSVEFQGVVGELEALLDERGKLTDAATLLTQDFLSVCGTDDNLTRRRWFEDIHRLLNSCYSPQCERG